MEAGYKLGTLRTDRGGEFTTRAFGDYCAGQGIQRHLPVPYTPQQNGVVERRNQTMLGMARCMLKTMGVPGRFWGEAVTTAVFILNRAPTKSLENKTPFEAWYGKKPAVHFFRTFGCVAHVKNTGGHLRKLDDRSKPMVFLWYEPGTKAYRLYDPNANRVHVSRDVVFEEGRAWDWSQGGAIANTGNVNDTCGDPFVVEYIYTPGAAGGEPSPSMERALRAASASPSTGQTTTSTTHATTPAPSMARSTTPSVPGAVQGATPNASSGGWTPMQLVKGGVPDPAVPEGVEFVSPPSQGIDLDSDHNVGDLRMLQDLYEETEKAELAGELMVAVGDGEAKLEPCWLEAMRVEMASIEQNNTWRLVDLPRGHKPIGLKWVFKIKRDEQGAIIKHKARLVAKGYVQQHGVDFGEVFAPVARMESVRVLLAVAAQ